MRSGGARREPDRLAVGVLHFVGGQVEVERAQLAAEARRDPAGQQVDRNDHAIAAIAVKDDGAGSDRLHG